MTENDRQKVRDAERRLRGNYVETLILRVLADAATKTVAHWDVEEAFRDASGGKGVWPDWKVPGGTGVHLPNERLSDTVNEAVRMLESAGSLRRRMVFGKQHYQITAAGRQRLKELEGES